MDWYFPTRLLINFLLRNYSSGNFGTVVDITCKHSLKGFFKISIIPIKRKYFLQNFKDIIHIFTILEKIIPHLILKTFQAKYILSITFCTVLITIFRIFSQSKLLTLTLEVILIFNHNLSNFSSLLDSWMGFCAPVLWPNSRPC